MINNLIPALLIASFISLISCQNNDEDPIGNCSTDTTILNNVYLDPGSPDSFQMFYEDNFYFSDSLDNLIKFIKNPRPSYTYHDTGWNYIGRQCAENELITEWYYDTWEGMQLQLQQDSGQNLGMTISIGLRTFRRVPNQEKDFDNMFLFRDLPDGGDVGNILEIQVSPVDPTSSFVLYYQPPRDSVRILGRTFYNVYFSADKGLYYNTDKGLIAFKDTLGHHWVQE